MQLLIKFYLAEKEQYANFCGYGSTCEKTVSEVPQGSV